MASKGNSRKLRNGLTPKENAFKDKVLEQISENKNINLTEAAMQTYDLTNRNTAKSLGSELMTKPDIREQIDAALEEHGISPSSVLKNIGKLAVVEPAKVTGETILKSNIELAKLLGMYPGKKSSSINVTLKGRLGTSSFKEAKEMYDAIDGEVVDLVEEADA